jgi:hypothetical protein
VLARDVRVGMSIRSADGPYLVEGKESYGHVQGEVVAVRPIEQGRCPLTLRDSAGREKEVFLLPDTAVELV